MLGERILQKTHRTLSRRAARLCMLEGDSVFGGDMQRAYRWGARVLERVIVPEKSYSDNFWDVYGELARPSSPSNPDARVSP